MLMCRAQRETAANHVIMMPKRLACTRVLKQALSFAGEHKCPAPDVPFAWPNKWMKKPKENRYELRECTGKEQGGAACITLIRPCLRGAWVRVAVPSSTIDFATAPTGRCW